jgi:hypothetical protein
MNALVPVRVDANAPSDLKRILALPRRPIVDTERERGTRRWAPATQALVEHVTAKYTRGQRLSCACRDRHVVAGSNGSLVIFPVGRPDAPPPLLIETTVDTFCRDAAHDLDAVKIVSGLRSGQSATLPGLGHSFCLTQLNAVQSWILWELPRAGGIFGMVSVGGGKTIASILVPLAMPQLKQWVLLAKPDQRIHYRSAYLRLREHFAVPTIIFDEKGLRGSYHEEGRPTLHFVPYSLLSNPKSTLLLESYDPDGVIADESHLLANRASSRTMRFLRIMAKRERVFCNWSGSTVKRSIKDVSHLSTHALGLGSPYPILPADVEAWSAVIDPSPIPDRTSSTAAALRRVFGSRDHLTEKLFEAGFHEDSGIREGHRDRVIETPGIVSTKSSSITCSITIRERKAPKMPEVVAEKLRRARMGVRPDGEELAEAVEIALCCRSVAAGYHYYWAFPKATEHDKIENGLIDQWFAARKAFNKELRLKLLRGEPYLDSRSLCENAAERAWRKPRYEGDLPLWPALTWPDWVEIRDEVEYDPRTKWIDEYLARDAAEWVKENTGKGESGIVWCQSSAFGRKVAQLAGVSYHGGGPEAEAKILAEDGRRSIVVSMRAHGESRDGLQLKFHKQLVAEVPPSGDRWEQLLGRLAREGQEADTIETEIYLHVSENREALRSAIALAEFIEETTPNKQLLLAADLGFDL